MRLVKFQHTIFAMPFALMAFAYAMWKYALAEVCPVPLWWCVPLVQVVLCMVFARNTAMGFNRWADRRIDAANPRTAGREIPAGVISPRRALTFVAVNALLFVACAATINRLTALLSPVALAVIMGYSYCKRFTWAAHLVLGLSLSIAPVGAYIALTGRFDWVRGHSRGGTSAGDPLAPAQHRHRLRHAQRVGESHAGALRDRPIDCRLVNLNRFGLC